MKKSKTEKDKNKSLTYIKPNTKKHQPVDIVKGSGGYSYTYYYYSLYYYCWVAREVYGTDNPRWLIFRDWMLNRAPSRFRTLYFGYGERFARFISDKPRLKAIIRCWMDTRIKGRIWYDGEVWSI